MHHTAYRREIEQAAHTHGVDPNVVEAMVLQESAGHAAAWNPEPKYRWFWDVMKHRPFRSLTPAEIASKWPPADFPALTPERDQEWWAQQASWGLLQVMGAVARERGFAGPYLPELCSNPAAGLFIGCKHFAGLLQWASGDVWKAVAAYNGGPNGWQSGQAQVHVRKVKAQYARVTA